MLFMPSDNDYAQENTMGQQPHVDKRVEQKNAFNQTWSSCISFDHDYAQAHKNATAVHGKPIPIDDALAEEAINSFKEFRLTKCSCRESNGSRYGDCKKCLVDEIDSLVGKCNEIHHWKHGKISVLQSRSDTESFKRKCLLNFTWVKIVTEFKNEFPFLFHLLMGLMASDLTNVNSVKKVFPRLGLVYAVLMQSNASDMSLLQRIISLVLLDANTEIHASNKTAWLC
jgi:hypothetical protein